LKYSFLILFFVILFPLTILSQRKNSYGQNIKMYPADRVLVGINYLQWEDLPAEIGLKSINRGFHLGYFLDNPIGGSRFSLGLGLSLTANNLYSDAIPQYLADSSSSYTSFIKIRNVSPVNNKFTNNKMTFTYAGVPVELRLRLGKDELWKISAGFEVGYMISSYVKYNGDNIFNQSNNNTIKFKFYHIENVMKLRYGLMFRIGYNRYNLRVFYPLTTNFQLDKGPQFYAVEIGFSLMVF